MMPLTYCPNCGAVVEGRYCAKCGTAVEQPAGGEPAAGPPPPSAEGGLQENMAGALCYLLGFITGIIFLVVEPYNRSRNIRFHAFQSIFLSVALFAFSILLTIVAMILPWFMGAMIYMVSMLVWIGVLILWLLLMFKAYNNQRLVLPVIGPMAEKQA